MLKCEQQIYRKKIKTNVLNKKNIYKKLKKK